MTPYLLVVNLMDIKLAKRGVPRDGGGTLDRSHRWGGQGE